MSTQIIIIIIIITIIIIIISIQWNLRERDTLGPI